MDWETDCWRAQTEPCVHQDPGERSHDPTRDCPRLARECPGVSGGGVGRRWHAAGSGALSAAVRARDLLKEVAIILTTSTSTSTSYPPPPPPPGLRSNNREGTQPCPSTENWTKDLLNMALPIRTRPSLPHSESLPSGSFRKPLILLQQRADRMKNTITEN